MTDESDTSTSSDSNGCLKVTATRVRDGTRSRDGRFLPSNPGGPGNPQLKALAAWRMAFRDCVTTEDIHAAYAVLAREMRKGEPWAVQEFFNRILGKPVQPVEVDEESRIMIVQDAP